MRELEREREEKAALAAEAERARIARELHDVLTHSMSVMVIQAQAAQAALGRSRRVAGALSRIETVGKESLVELRRLLQRVRGRRRAPALAPAPGLAQLESCSARCARPASTVSLALDGEARPLPASVDLSAYRIVQEALTNTLRHAGTVTTQIVLHYRPDELALEVIDQVARRQGAPATGAAWPGCASGSRSQAASSSPRTFPEAGSAWRAASAAGGAVTLRVCVADDQELVRDGFRMILQASGIEVAGEARDGREAIALARRPGRTSC